MRTIHVNRFFWVSHTCGFFPPALLAEPELQTHLPVYLRTNMQLHLISLLPSKRPHQWHVHDCSRFGKGVWSKPVVQYNIMPCVGVRAALPAQNQQRIPQRINTNVNSKHCSSVPQRLSATLENQSCKQSTCCSDLLQTSAPFPCSFTPPGEALLDLPTFPNSVLWHKLNWASCTTALSDPSASRYSYGSRQI